jgi:hypothetical protein
MKKMPGVSHGEKSGLQVKMLRLREKQVLFWVESLHLETDEYSRENQVNSIVLFGCCGSLVRRSVDAERTGDNFRPAEMYKTKPLISENLE